MEMFAISPENVLIKKKEEEVFAAEIS